MPILVRPLAICELIEHQISFADFSVDPAAVNLLRFKRAAFAAFTGDSLVKGSKDLNWGSEQQHVFYDNLSRAANALIISAPEGERIVRFDKFDPLLQDNTFIERLTPLPNYLKPWIFRRNLFYGFDWSPSDTCA